MNSCLPEAFEYILVKKTYKHLFAHNRLSGLKNLVHCGRSTGDLLPFLTKSWSSSVKGFHETFAVSSAFQDFFGKFWYKALISKLLSYGFYPSVCIFASSFLPDLAFATTRDGHSSSLKSINSSVPLGSVLSLIIFYY